MPTNSEIKSKSMQLIQLKLKDIMLNLAIDMCDLHMSRKDLPLSLPSEIDAVIEEIQGRTKVIIQTLETDLSERDDYVRSLTELRAKYTKLCAPVYTYITQLNQAGSYAMWNYKCKSAEEMPVANYLEIERNIKGFVTDYIEEAESLPEKHYRMSSIISLIPLRMTRERYNDIVREGVLKSLEEATKSEIELAVNMFKTAYCPVLSDGYGTVLPEMKERLTELCGRNTDTLDKEALETYLGEVDSAMADLEEITDYLNIAYNDINYLIALASFCIDNEYLIGDDVLLGDVAYSCRDMLTGGDYDMYAEPLIEKAEDEVEERFAKLRELENQLNEYLTKHPEATDNDEQLHNIVGTYVHITTLYLMELEHEYTNDMYSNDETPADSEYVNTKVEEVISFIANAPESISVSRNKFVRRSFLQPLPAVMEDTDFYNYVEYALEPLRNKPAGVATITDICNLLVSYGIIPDPDDDYDEDECGCGHDHHDHHDHHHNHHHDHNCGCGHDHHHPHLHILKDDE
jgi:hypothetical protein